MILTMAMAAALAAQTGPAAQVGQATPPRRAHAGLNQYFSSDDYPPNAVARRATGAVGFQLDIGADGAVTRCTITRSSNDAALDAATCAILLGRARYDPARDSAGRAVPGTDTGRVTWRLPPVTHGTFGLMRTVSRLSSNAAGALGCVFTANGVAQADLGPSRCGMLAGTGAEDFLRDLPVPVEVILVSAAGPVEPGTEAVGADEAGYGVLQYDLVWDLAIGQDGRIAQCRVVTRNVAPATPLFLPPDLCEPAPAGSPPMFEPSADPEPRRARYRFALYLKGWPAGPAPTPTPTPTPTPVPPRP